MKSPVDDGGWAQRHTARMHHAEEVGFKLVRVLELDADVLSAPAEL